MTATPPPPVQTDSVHFFFTPSGLCVGLEALAMEGRETPRGERDEVSGGMLCFCVLFDIISSTKVIVNASMDSEELEWMRRRDQLTKERKQRLRAKYDDYLV